VAPEQRWSRSKAVMKSATNNATLNARGDTRKSLRSAEEPKVSALLICRHQIRFAELTSPLFPARSVRASQK